MASLTSLLDAKGCPLEQELKLAPPPRLSSSAGNRS